MPSYKSFQMIVFDKDGTLGNDQASLIRWVQHMTKQAERELLEIHKANDVPAMMQEFHAALGFCASPNGMESGGSLMPSAPVASATWGQILEICTTKFAAMGITNAADKVAKWHAAVQSLHGQDPPLVEDLPGLMRKLKDDYGFQIAICTSDDRSSTDSSIQNWKLTDLVDYSICGNEVTHGKPSTEPILTLCKQAGVKPSECIMVGDTTADTGMGQNANVGLVIGVLSGSGTREQLLATGATVTLEDVGKIPEYLQSTMSN